VVPISYNPRQMIVTFYKGALRTETGDEVAISWAETDFGLTALISGSDKLVHELDVERLAASELITRIDLPGLDREGFEVIAGSILKGGYLDMPGVQGKGEAVLFVLLNEAIHELGEIAKDENED
jgi:hypothetical protein